MKKTCIFELKKICNHCGECLICDLDRNKKCDNCERCLNLNDNDLKEIKIDEVLEDSEELSDEETFELKEINEIEVETDTGEEWILIDDIANDDDDDIEKIKDVIKQVEKGEDITKLGYAEEYPGLIIKKKS